MNLIRAFQLHGDVIRGPSSWFTPAAAPVAPPPPAVCSLPVDDDFIQIGETKERAGMRIHRFATAFQVHSIADAGKRGRVCPYFGASFAYTTENREGIEIATALMAAPNFDAAFAAVKAIAARASMQIYVDMHEKKCVHVTPGGFEEVNIDGRYAGVSAGRDSFSVSDKEDQNNLPACISSSVAGKRGVAKFYAWAKANRARLAGMKYHVILTAMREEIGVECHSYCRMD